MYFFNQLFRLLFIKLSLFGLLCPPFSVDRKLLFCCLFRSELTWLILTWWMPTKPVLFLYVLGHWYKGAAPPWITSPQLELVYMQLPIPFLRYLSELTPGLDDFGCRAFHLNAVGLTSTKAVPLSLRLSVLNSFETTSSISETVSATVEDSEFMSKLIQLLGWLTIRSLKIWSVPKSMFQNRCSLCTSLCTPLGPSGPS